MLWKSIPNVRLGLLRFGVAIYNPGHTTTSSFPGVEKSTPSVNSFSEGHLLGTTLVEPPTFREFARKLRHMKENENNYMAT